MKNKVPVKSKLKVKAKNKSQSKVSNKIKPVLKIGIVTSLFNREITEGLEKGALEQLQKLNIKSNQVINTHVPGAVEIPIAAKWLLENGCDGVITLGAVIRGETSHYDYVCNSVERGVSQLMLEYNKPVAFGVLTTENEEQAWDRVTGSHGNKGAEAATVVIEMIALKNKLYDSYS